MDKIKSVIDCLEITSVWLVLAFGWLFTCFVKGELSVILSVSICTTEQHSSLPSWPMQHIFVTFSKLILHFDLSRVNECDAIWVGWLEFVSFALQLSYVLNVVHCISLRWWWFVMVVVKMTYGLRQRENDDVCAFERTKERWAEQNHHHFVDVDDTLRFVWCLVQIDLLFLSMPF